MVTPAGEGPAAVRVEGERIVAIEPYDGAGGEDLGDVALLPGLVDTHVHVNEPGRTEWEGFATATRAAAAGGVTTILDMPLNSVPPTVDLAALGVKRHAATGQCTVDVGFWGGAVPGNAAALGPLSGAGVFGFKCFLAPSGVDEFGPLDEAGLAAALRAAPDALFAVHAEDPASLQPAPSSVRYADFLASRPGSAETAAVQTVLRAAESTRSRVHVLHVSCADVLDALAAARRDGARVTAETCPHYLSLAAEDIADGATEFKCCPPIRDSANREALWQGLAAGQLDCVVSDHSPCPPALKAGDFAQAWGGIASIQLGLSIVWTGARQRGHALGDVARWMATRPAEMVGLRRKGRIAVGCDADLVAFDPVGQFTVDPAGLLHRHKLTPYAGQTLTGIVQRTWLRGEVVDGGPRGRLLAREDLP